MKIADETLNHLADTFIAAQIGDLFKITFYQYAQRAPLYNEMYRHFQQGQGINISLGQARLAC